MYQSGQQRQFRPATARDFAPREKGQRGSGGPKPPNDLVDETTVVLESLTPDRETEGGAPQTWLIPLPTQDGYLPAGAPMAWAPGMVPGEQGNLVPGQWLKPYPVHRFGQLKRQSLIPFDPDLINAEDPDARAWIYANIPTVYFKDKLWTGLQSGHHPEFEALVKSPRQGQPRNKVGNREFSEAYMPDYETNFVVRGLILQRGNKVYSPPMGWEGKVPLFLLSKPQGAELKACLIQRAATDECAPSGHAEDFFLVDPTDWAAPRVICFYQAGFDPEVLASQHAAAGLKKFARRYPKMHRDFPDALGRDPAILGQFAAQFLPRLLPFHQVVKVADEELQVRRLAEAFPRAVGEYAFRERADWMAIAESVWGKVTTSPPPAQQPPAQGGYAPAHQAVYAHIYGQPQPQASPYAASQAQAGPEHGMAPVGHGYGAPATAPQVAAPYAIPAAPGYDAARAAYAPDPATYTPAAVPAAYPAPSPSSGAVGEKPPARVDVQAALNRARALVKPAGGK